MSSGTSSSRVVSVSQRGAIFARASDAPAATAPSFLTTRRRTLSTAAATACHDDCGKPCPEDCEGHTVHPAHSSGPINHFQVLGLADQSYNVDAKALKSQYKRLMVQYHPDRYNSLHDPSAAPAGGENGHAPKSLDELHELSSSITRAYDVLSDPHSRAEHMLELSGAAITENCAELVDMALLMEVMELREEIDEAAQDAGVLRTLLGQNEQRMEHVVKRLGEAFDSDGCGGGENIEEARRLTAQLQYWKRIEEKIVDKLSTVK